jgi:hypothetical protein
MWYFYLLQLITRIYCFYANLFNLVHLFIHSRRIEPATVPWVQWYNWTAEDGYCEYGEDSAAAPVWYYGMNEDCLIVCGPKPVPTVLRHRTRVFFIDITLYDNKAKTSVPISLPTELYVTDNCILSVHHLARYFEYNIMPFEFSGDYQLHILTDRLESVPVLGPDAYIRLLPDKYLLIRPPAPLESRETL